MTYKFADSDFVFRGAFPKRGTYDWSTDVECLFTEVDGCMWMSHYSWRNRKQGLLEVDRAELLAGTIKLIRSSLMEPTITEQMKFKKLVMTIGAEEFVIDRLL